jgi:uncharacterized repeat protein (TIGR01451 family)
MKKIWIKATILLIAMVLVSSSIAIADINNLETQKSLDTNPIITSDIINKNVGSKGDNIVWDNGLDYDGFVAAVEPLTPGHIDVYPADDFEFETLTYVTGVRWIGGYIDANPETWDWCIVIYFDDGTGDFPGEEIIDSFCYSWEDINKEEIVSGIWEMWVELPYSIVFQTDKFWISIYAVGDSLPTSVWGYHFDTIILKQAVFKSDYYGYPNWIFITKMVDYPADMCYQLISSGNLSINVEKQVMDKNGEWHDGDTENEALDVVICNDITFKIVIENDGDFPLYDIVVSDVMEDGLSYVSADPEPDEYTYDPPYHYMWWNFSGELIPSETIEIEITAHVEGPECSTDYNYVQAESEEINGYTISDEDYCYVHSVEKSKSINTLFLNFLENHQFLLKIFQIMFHRLELQ